jgi:hypothetical protein
MNVFRFPAIIVAISLVFLTSCGETPSSSTGKQAEPVKPPEPVTGLTALYRMYSMARQWAPDAQVLRARSIRLSEVRSVDGKSGAWEATFVSPGTGRARTYTDSIVEAQGNLHIGVFAGLVETYSGPRGQERPFPVNVVATDTDKAYATALKTAADYAKAHPKTPISFLLELTAQHTNPTWRVVWGESVASSDYSVLVDAATGEVLQVLR